MPVLVVWELAQVQQERRRWLRSAAGVLAACGAAVVIARWNEGPTAALSPSGTPLVIEMMASPQAPQRPSVQPPGPKQVEAPQPKPEPPLKPDPEPRAELETPMPSSDVALSASQPEASEPSQARPPAPETTAPTSQREAPATSAAGAPSAAQVHTQATFSSLLLAHLEQYKRYPRTAQTRRQQGMPYIRFVMDREGRVLSAALEKASGFALLDAEALAVLERAQPLPALPDQLGEVLEIVVPIEFFLRR